MLTADRKNAQKKRGKKKSQGNPEIKVISLSSKRSCKEHEARGEGGCAKGNKETKG